MRLLELCSARFAAAESTADWERATQLVRQVLRTDSSLIATQTKLLIWTEALEQASRAESYVTLDELFSLRHSRGAGWRDLPALDHEVIGRTLDQHPEKLDQAPFWRLLEVDGLIGRDDSRALLLLEWIQQQIDASPDWLGTYQGAHDLLKAKVYLSSERPRLAGKILRPLMQPFLRGAAPPKFAVFYTWVSYLLKCDDQETAIEHLDVILSRESGSAYASAQLQELRALRGISWADGYFSGDNDGRQARVDLQEALNSGKLPRASGCTARLMLTEILRDEGEPRLFLESLGLAEELVDDSGSVLHRMQLECLRTYSDELLELPLAARQERKRKLDRLWSELTATWYSAPPSTFGVGTFVTAERREALSTLIGQALDLEPGRGGVERALQHVIQVQMAGELVRHADSPAPTMDDVRARFEAVGRGALVFAPARRRSHLFLIDQDGVHHTELAGVDSLKRIATSWQRSLGIPQAEIEHLTAESAAVLNERSCARAVSAALFPPGVRQRVASWTSITTVGIGAFLKSSIDWLPLASEPYLGANREITIWPSLPAGLLLEQGRRDHETSRSGGLRILLAGGAAQSRAFRARWPETRDIHLPAELETRLRGASAVQSLTLLEGSDLTPNSLGAAMNGTPDVALLFLHAVQDRQSDLERPTALALSADPSHPLGLFSSRSLQPLWDPLADSGTPVFAILAACRSGGGRERSGSGIGTDLGSAFLLAGTKTVLTSHEDILLEPAGAFMAVTMQAVGMGASPAAAVLAGRHSAIDEYRERAPFLFHGLRLVGAPGDSVPFAAPANARRDSSSPRHALLMLLVSACLGIGLWIGRTLRARR